MTEILWHYEHTWIGRGTTTGSRAAEQAALLDAEDVREHVDAEDLWVKRVSYQMLSRAEGERLTLKQMNAAKIPIFRQWCE